MQGSIHSDDNSKGWAFPDLTPLTLSWVCMTEQPLGRQEKQMVFIKFGKNPKKVCAIAIEIIYKSGNISKV